MTAVTASPQAYLQAQARWHPFEVAFWLAMLLPYLLFPDYLSLASQIAITALFALSLDLILGYAGVVSLGHAAFFGIGAYSAGILSKTFSFELFGVTVNWPGWGEPLLGLLFAAFVAGFAGYATSFIVSRFRHLTLIMITLGIGFIAQEIANRAHWLTGGSDSLQGINIGKLLGVFKFDLYGYTAYTYSLAVLFLVFLGVRRLVHSPFGLALRGVRENWVRMPAIGADSRAHIRLAYTIAAAIAGVAGALLTQTTQTAALGSINFERSADVLVMLVLGGSGRLYGGLIGAAVFMIARDQISNSVPQYWFFWIGLLLIGVVMFLPNGILGGLSDLYARWWKRK
jgi:branched-chain amino acid transport system permease protein